VGRRRQTILRIAASAAVGGTVLAAPPSLAQQQPAPPPAANGSAPTTNPTSRPAAPARADVAGDLAALRATLTQPDARPGDREQAAARLVSRDRPEADEVLGQVLTGESREARLAVARALVDDPTPSDALIRPLADAMRAGVDQRSINLVDAAAQALASYRGNEAALDELVRFATDGNLPLDARARAARALGRVVEPASARTLVMLLRERAPLRTAAADALADLTGSRQLGADAERWTAWLQNNAAEMASNRDGWRARMLEARAAQLDRVRRRHDALVDALDDRLLDQYRNTPADQRSGLLLSLLNSEQPDERAIAAQLVARAFRNADPVTEAVRDRLTAMVGDSDAGVRYEVASTLRNLNHRPALGAELTQLAQERDELVKVALVDAIGTVGDPAAAPQVAQLLITETSARVITAAAKALGTSGRGLRNGDPALWDRVTRRLRQLALGAGVGPDVRVAAIDALTALQDPELLELCGGLLSANRPDPSPLVRQAALRALGALTGNAAAEGAEIITRVLGEDRDPAVRRAAVDALGRVGNLPEHGILLMQYGGPREPDEGVRLAANDAFLALLPRATPAQLNRERPGLKNDPVRNAAVLEELCRQLERSPAPQDKEDLANLRVELGDVNLKQGQPAKAAANYRTALDYYLRTNHGENVVTPLIQQLIDALLAARDYTGAVRFAEEMIQRDQKNQDTVGPAIRNEADRLRMRSDPKAALQLINEALRMNPALDDRFQRDLKTMRDELRGPQ
jgi:HEAT repeat protein